MAQQNVTDAVTGAGGTGVAKRLRAALRPYRISKAPLTGLDVLEGSEAVVEGEVICGSARSRVRSANSPDTARAPAANP
ncbi:hypothetical protein ACIHCV_39925 [Streptomyces sp. NPDC051956]|uniref:hypothetical protein n=1 Tax=Streptomyces sp. NPDC051956 TaxID=3365677 RepID=UPI0037CEBCFB